jgi:putative transposase
MGWFSRKVLSWLRSNTMECNFCVDALEEAIRRHGAQFSSEAFTGVLKASGVKIRKIGNGRWIDNAFVERLWRSVKYGEVYLRPMHP